MKKKAVALLSGGLDSSVAVMVAKDIGIDVHGIFMKSVFFTGKKDEKLQKVQKFTDDIGIPLSIIDIEREFINILRNPRYGYGKNNNPCIDCHCFFLKKAKAFLPVVDADFIITGEVVGQRDMSQKLKTILIIEKNALCNGIVLRPLCGKLMPETEMEKCGIIKRDDLLDIFGKSRAPQIELVKKYRLDINTHSGGGCLLTEKSISGRIRNYINEPMPDNFNYLKLLPFGRHFRLSDNVKFVVGRDEKENDRICSSINFGDIIIPDGLTAGPSGILFGEYKANELEIALKIISKYCDGQGIKNLILKTSEYEKDYTSDEISDEDMKKLMIR